VTEYVVPAKNRPLSNSFPTESESLGVPLVTVCAAESSFDHVTLPPASIVTSGGSQHVFVSSHPGTEVPDGTPTPQSSGSSSGQEVAALKNAMSSLQKDVSEIKLKIGAIDSSSGEINTEAAYNFAVFGLSLGAAGVILAIIAMLKRK